MIIGAKKYHPINAFFYTVSIMWLALLLYFFLAVLALLLINIIIDITGISLLMMFPLAVTTMIIVIGTIVYGIIHANRPKIIDYTIHSPELLPAWKGKNIILISDMHLGLVRSRHFTKKVVRKINALSPDLVIIAGDIIDGPVFDYERGLSPLKDLHSTYGVFYTPGNHEDYNSENEKFYPIVKSLTNTLIDEKAEINGTQIIGLRYHEESLEDTSARLEKTGYDKGRPSIVILHDPRNTPALQNAGVSLVVSGHTHKGQFFPANFIVRFIYKEFIYGMHMHKNTVSITTSGIGTMMMPIRIGTRAEIVRIRVK
jgi:predicted MPP superfamily phosphohydrolase